MPAPDPRYVAVIVAGSMLVAGGAAFITILGRAYATDVLSSMGVNVDGTGSNQDDL